MPASSLPPHTWNAWAAAFPSPQLLQSWEWGQSKIRNGWQPLYLTWRVDARGALNCQAHTVLASAPGMELPAEAPHAMALVLKRALPIRGLAARLSVLYVPRGPLLQDWGDAALRQKVLSDLADLARQQGAIFIKIDPEAPLGVGVPGEPDAREDPVGAALTADLHAQGWHFSPEQVQFRNTVLLDLRPSEEELLARMKQKARYNIRLAQRKGVTVRLASPDDLDLLYQMYAETALRDGFTIREQAYYMDLWRAFMPDDETANLPAWQPATQPLIAEVERQPVAGVFVFRFAGRAWYLFGMSRQAHREKMPSALLQWEAMLRARAAGCLGYDLWGAPDVFDESDPMWGVFRFKQGLGGEVLRTLGAWDYPVRPFYYRLYAYTLPRLLGLLRRRGRALTRRSVDAQG